MHPSPHDCPAHSFKLLARGCITRHVINTSDGTLSPSGAAGSRFRPSILQLQSRSVISQTDITTYKTPRNSLFRVMQIQRFVRSKKCEAAVNIGLVSHSASQTHDQAPGNIPTLAHKHGQHPSASELPITALVESRCRGTGCRTPSRANNRDRVPRGARWDRNGSAVLHSEHVDT